MVSKPATTTGPVPNVVLDVEGNALRPGYKVSTSLVSGMCEVIGIPSPGIIRLKDKFGRTHDIAAKLGNVKLIPHLNPQQRTTTQRFGI